MMKIALVSTGKTAQDKDLLLAANQKGHNLDIVRYPFSKTSLNKEESVLINQCQLIYWRVGNLKLREIVAKMARRKKIPFINSAYSLYPNIGKKTFQMKRTSIAGIKTPKTLTVKKVNLEYFQKIKKELKVPFIAKPIIGAQGSNVYLINDYQQFKALFKNKKISKFLFQKFLPNDGDYRVLTVGYKAIGLYKRVPKKGEIRANIAVGGQGKKVEDEKTIKELSRLGKKISRILCLEIAGLDFIEFERNFYFIESNSIPQWQGFQKTTGINMGEKIIEYFEQLLGTNQKSF